MGIIQVVRQKNKNHEKPGTYSKKKKDLNKYPRSCEINLEEGWIPDTQYGDNIKEDVIEIAEVVQVVLQIKLDPKVPEKFKLKPKVCKKTQKSKR